jgi:hypothetical protein
MSDMSKAYAALCLHCVFSAMSFFEDVSAMLQELCVGVSGTVHLYFAK